MIQELNKETAIYVFMLCLCFAGVFSKPTEATRKNPDDVAKLKKFVNEQIKKDAKLSKDINEQINGVEYEWDEKGNIKFIRWEDCNFTGSIKVPSFSNLEYVMILGNNPGLKSIDAGINQSLISLVCRGSIPSDMDKQKSAINKLSVKGCKNLKYLEAGWNNFKSIDLSGNKNLELLGLPGCKLRKLNISKNRKLSYLNISDSKNLLGIDTKDCPALETLYISGVGFTEIDISKNTRLKEFYFDRAKFTSMDLRKNKKLELLSCKNGALRGNGLLIGKNSNISDVRCRGNKLSKLDVTKCENLKKLDLTNNNIPNLDISKNNKLEELFCSKNPLGKLELSNLANLVMLWCNNCKLRELDLKGTGKLEYLHCDNNKIKRLDISGLEHLGYLYCRNNLLKHLDITENKRLRELHCENNKIKKLDIRNCEIKKYLSFGDEFFSHDTGVVIVKKRKTGKI